MEAAARACRVLGDVALLVMLLLEEMVVRMLLVREKREGRDLDRGAMMISKLPSVLYPDLSSVLESRNVKASR